MSSNKDPFEIIPFSPPSFSKPEITIDYNKEDNILIVSIKGKGKVEIEFNRKKPTRMMEKIEKGDASLSEIERAMCLNVSEEGGNPKWVVEVYEKNKDSFITNAMARIYYATALCQLAGSAKKEEEQVFWVRKGIMEFEMIIEDFPNEHKVALWRAITYSHFPPVLGATNYVIDDVEHINELRAKGVKFAPEEIALLTKSYLNIAKVYKSPEFLNMAKKQFDKDKTYLKESIITELSNQIAKVEEEIK